MAMPLADWPVAAVDACLNYWREDGAIGGFIKFKFKLFADCCNGIASVSELAMDTVGVSLSEIELCFEETPPAGLDFSMFSLKAF